MFRYDQASGIPNKKPMTDQDKDTPKVQLGEAMSFIGVTYRFRTDPSSCISKPTPVWTSAHKSRKTGAHCPTFRKLSRLEGILFRKLSRLEGVLSM